MRGIGMWDSSSISTLFSGFSSSRSSRSSNAASSFIANMDMTTYSGIRSGSYFKLLKSYYGNNLNSKAQSLVSSSVSTAKVGITVDSKSGKLSVDEDTFKKADSTKVDALFKGNGSYAYAVASKASMLEYAAKNEAEKTNTYGANGRYTQAYNSGYNYNMFL